MVSSWGNEGLDINLKLQKENEGTGMDNLFFCLVILKNKQRWLVGDTIQSIHTCSALEYIEYIWRESLLLVSQSGCANKHSLQECMRFLLVPHPQPHLIFYFKEIFKQALNLYMLSTWLRDKDNETCFHTSFARFAVYVQSMWHLPLVCGICCVYG